MLAEVLNVRNLETEGVQKFALLSVYNREGIDEFAKGLNSLGYGIIAHQRTADSITSGVNLEITDSFLNFETMRRVIEPERSRPIELVVCNLPNFPKKPEPKYDLDGDILEISAVVAIRAAAKNFESCIPVISPSDYEMVINTIKEGKDDIEFRQNMATKVWIYIARYNGQISRQFSKTYG